jgi:hypothetical protein
MTSTPSFLEFFVLEAGEYVEQLDGLLVAAGSSGGTPDADAMQRVARALRGSATMAKLAPFAEVAAGLERVGRSLADRRLSWDPGLRGAIVAAVDDLKILLRNARNWSAADDQRAATRVAELTTFAPAVAPRPSAATTGIGFFASEASNIAAGLELLITRPDDRDTAAAVLKRARALRGVAGITELGDLAEVLDATDDAARELERGGRALSDVNAAVIRAAAALLRLVTTELRDATSPDAGAPARVEFGRAVETWSDHEMERERVLPLSDLYFKDDGPHVVDRATHPPTSAVERFRLELVSRGEHLRGLLDTARARPNDSPERVRRQFRRALAGVASAMTSFGERDLAVRIEAFAAEVRSAARPDLGQIEGLAGALTAPGERAERVRALFERRTPTPAMGLPPIAPAMGAIPMAPPVPNPAPPVRRNSPPVGAITAPADVLATLSAPRATASPAAPADVLATLNAGMASLDSLMAAPLAAPRAMSAGEIVPIENLLYRGASALARARELRDEIRNAGTAPPRDVIDELFDLVDLVGAK